ncbi:16S rRNA (cytidine(1402)-2'-O)-methyltransferase [Gemmatimonas sp.]|uniref:16S rRNA (cytidine(1402)-2'-O)-methyltransferase n=1 Tax=Gemmatimonas sp. TaxID=1962908 RepID=UPI0035690FCD
MGDAPGSAESEVIASDLADRAATLWPSAAISGALHIVSTPIGNLGDISLRALAVLKEASVICCEDTRHARTLLSRYGIGTPTIAVHEHNEASVIPRLVARLKEGEAIALISDAGTPLVSDPGARLTEAAASAGLRVVPIPGASAVLAALVASGMVPHPFTMLGFPARKGKEREEQLALAARLPHAVVLYESPNRLVDTLRDLAAIAGTTRPVAVARELTKHFEEVKRGTLEEVAAYYEGTPPRGEIVIVLGGASFVAPSEDGLQAVAGALREEGFRPREIVQRLMDEHGASRNLAYRLAHDT